MSVQHRKKVTLADTAEVAAKKHIQELRKKKFSIGAEEPNPLTQDLHHAVTCLSAELYTKDVHFLMELIQNAEDNQYAEGLEPTLEFALTTQDITGCGAKETLLVFNNEVGFTRQNMESICSVGLSTKKGQRNQGFIGEKGIGFKSVFLVTKQPHIVSNGYKVKFNEEPDKDCAIGYIVPEWISDESFIPKIKDLYGSEVLPMTIIVLPLKEDKVKPVKEELSSLHPELLLFLSKLRRLYVRENSNDAQKGDIVTAISIISETNHVLSRDKHADSRVIHLSVKEKADATEENCQYYLWRQSFPVTPEAKVSGRANVKEWSLSLAFPFGRRLKRGTSLVGVFAFLPTSMVTNFPFVIQADFILASSRETIMFDSTWNQGILKCVPLAFVDAFTSCVRERSPLFSEAQAFEFLPSKFSAFPKLNEVRETIRKTLLDSAIVPCETFSSEMTFRKPTSAVKILPSFREILFKMKRDGVCLAGLSTMKSCLVHSSLDRDKYGSSLEFLGIRLGNDWYRCFAACSLISQASNNTYIDLLFFLSCNVTCGMGSNTPLFKFTDKMGNVRLCSLARIKQGRKILYGEQPDLHAWLHKCNMQFGCPNQTFFLPNSFRSALASHPKAKQVLSWLWSYAGIQSCSALDYSLELCHYISRKVDSDVAVTFSNFLYHSKLKNFLVDSDLSIIAQSMPIVDGSGRVRMDITETLVPAFGSKWVKLFGPTNPFVLESYVDIGEAYNGSREFAGEYTPDGELISFLIVHTGGRDLPDILPPNLPLQVACSQMTSEQAFTLLDWIRFHRTRGATIPQRFIESIRSGKWMKTKSGVDCPRDCTIPNDSGKALLDRLNNVLVGFSIVDEEFYGEQITLYTNELMFLGVRCGISGLQDLVMDRFKHLGSSAMNRETAFSLLLFVGFLKERKMLDEQWLKVMSHGRWLRTYRCYDTPRNSFFFQSESEAEAALILTRLHIVHGKFYGGKLSSFTDELLLLGLKSESEVYSVAAENLVLPDNPLSLTSSCGIFILKCLRNIRFPATSFTEKVSSTPWLKTNFGFRCPSASMLDKPEWYCLLMTAKVPIIDEGFYENGIRLYLDELKAIGVAVESVDVLKIVVKNLKTLLSSSEAPRHLTALLHCMTELKRTMSSTVLDLCEYLRDEKILKTRHGYRKPSESILFNSKWASISLFVDLPLIDDSYYGIQLYGLRDELKMMGVLSSLEDGAIFIARGLTRPIETALVTAEGTLSLLDGLKILMADGNDEPCLNTFLENVMRSELLKTSCGYRIPKDSVLFNCGWKDMLELTDAPFIDDKYYGNDMSSYLRQLKVLGVNVEPSEACILLSQSLPLLAETPAIRRIYAFLKEFKWKPAGIVNLKIWIPTKEACSEGRWVDSDLCVLHDKANHFAPILHSLDTYYEEELLPFFSATFGVLKYPCTSHYLQMWSLWESRETSEISHAECCFFWGYILKNWNPEIEDTLKKDLGKVPAVLSDKSNLLVSKEHVFVPDNLWFKKIFIDAGDSPLFVWMPSSSMFSVVSPRKLCASYNALGVRKLSESVKCSVTILQSSDQPNVVDLKKKLIVKGLLEIILGFLACKIHMPVKERHEAVMSLLSLSVIENNANVQVCFQLHLDADRCLQKEVEKLVHWDKKSQTLFIDGAFSENLKASAKFVNFFAEEVAEGLLPRESATVVNDLRNLIQTGFLFEFEEQSVQFLLTRENMEVLMEDEKFLASAFPSTDGLTASVLAKRASSVQESLAPLTPSTSQRSKRRRLDDIVSAGEVGQLKFNSIDADSMLSCKKKVGSKAEAAEDLIMSKYPLTAYFASREQLRKKYKVEHPQINSAVDVPKTGSEIWRTKSDIEKAPYIEMSEKKKAEYGKELEAYKSKLAECRGISSIEEAQSDDRNEEDEGSKKE